MWHKLHSVEFELNFRPFLPLPCRWGHSQPHLPHLLCRAVMIAVMTEAKATDMELKGHSLTDVEQEDRHISHCMGGCTDRARAR